MALLQALLYVAAIVLIAVGAFPTRSRAALAVLGAALALTAYALPAITAAG